MQVDWWRFTGVLGILLGTLFLWLLLGRVSGRARHRFQDLLRQSQAALDDPDAGAQVESAQRRLTAMRLLVNGARYALLFGALLLLLGQLKIELGTLLLPAGFLGAAIGLGSQNLVRDLVAGFFIVFEEQFGVGDRVTINGTSGTVEELGLRVTRVRDEANQVHFFPNGAIATVSRQPRRAVSLILFVPLANAQTRAQAIAAVRRTINEFEEVHDALAGDIEALDDDGALLRMRLSARPHRAAFAREKLPARVTGALEAAEIEKQKGADVEITFAP